MKICVRCNEPKDESAFGTDNRRPDGKRSYCRICTRALTAAYREDPEYRQRDREYSLDYSRRHKQERMEYRAKYEAKQETRHSIRRQSGTWRARNLEKLLFYRAKASAKEHCVEFNLDPDDIKIPPICPILSIPLLKSLTGHSCANSPSVDRIIPSRGYVKGNVQIISHRANTIKSDATIEEIEIVAAYMRRIIGSPDVQTPNILNTQTPLAGAGLGL